LSKPYLNQRAWGLAVFLLSLVLAAVPAPARTHHSESWARAQFATAERMREALNGRPARERTRREYRKVMDAYRRVYYGSPASSKADPSVVAVAELLVEMGRCFDDARILRSAIGQYQFLRREYPGSRYRFDALFTIGEIYQDDLDNPAQARQTFEEFLRRYPRHRLAVEARKAAAAPLQRTAARAYDGVPFKAEDPDPEQGAKKDAKVGEKNPAKDAAETTNHAQPAPRNGASSPAKDAKAPSPADERDETTSTDQNHDPGKMPRVTGIRHWSTGDYTRVAIDLEQEVEYNSQRIDNPDRIFFDLYGTKLASTLVGKSFDVADGFLKKIRVAQYQPNRTRVVLEVDNLSEYSAFLLPNPYRLIIDIHGKQSAKARTSQAASHSAPTPADSPEEIAEAGPPAKPAPAIPGAGPTGDNQPGTKPEIRARNAKLGQAPRASRPAPGTRKVVDADEGGDQPAVATLEPPTLKPSTPSSKSTVEATNGTPKEATRASSKEGSKEASKETSRSKSRHGKKSKAEPEIIVREARPTAEGDRSLIRALGLKIGKIVIDAGHGGHDTGTIGPNGVKEKDVVLDVAHRLGKLLEARLGAEVVYTREDDTFIPLETRTAIANQEQADLFVSVHANSSDDPDARGVETYYLNFTSSRDALEVAARENAVSDKSIHELQDLVKKIALKEKIEESKEFASNVQTALHSGLSLKNPGIRNRGVKKAPFIVLIGANMPSILAEISFVSNPTDARKLETTDYRQRIAESLYRGISKYVGGLSGVKVASRLDKAGGQ
jgi:N-acetylmuramoyl-L-alanine amidase